MISTDGVSVSILLLRKDLVGKRLPRMKIKDSKELYIDELTNYIVIKDGHVLIKNLSESYEDVEIKAAEYSKDRQYINNMEIYLKLKMKH